VSSIAERLVAAWVDSEPQILQRYRAQGERDTADDWKNAMSATARLCFARQFRPGPRI